MLCARRLLRLAALPPPRARSYAEPAAGPAAMAFTFASPTQVGGGGRRAAGPGAAVTSQCPPGPVPSRPVPSIPAALSPQVFYNGAAVKQVDVPTLTGSFGILAAHVPTLQVLKPGVVTVYGEDGTATKYFGEDGDGDGDGGAVTGLCGAGRAPFGSGGPCPAAGGGTAGWGPRSAAEEGARRKAVVWGSGFLLLRGGLQHAQRLPPGQQPCPERPLPQTRGRHRELRQPRAWGLLRDLLRHFAPQLPGQQRAAAAGHRHHPADPERPPQRHATLPGHAPVPGAAPLPDAVLLLLLFLLLAPLVPGPRHQNYLRAAAGGRGLPAPAPRRPVPKPDPDVQAQRRPLAADGEPGDALQGGAAAAADAAEAAAQEGAPGRPRPLPLAAQPQVQPHQQQQQRLQRGQPRPGLRGLGLEAGGQGGHEVRVRRSIEPCRRPGAADSAGRGAPPPGG
uniref:ATP synthase F(1) complex subunit delta, mitochondrial n=1 Tax=Anser cygnoides TaxID=8845 RepID=A0A8B9EAH0_ANSCY